MEIVEQLNELKHKMLSQIDRDVGTVERNGSLSLEIRERVASERRDYGQYLAQIEQIANELLRTYRDENAAARSTPVPAHFGERFPLQIPDLGDPIPPNGVGLEQQNHLRLRQLSDARAQVIRSCDDAVASFNTIAILTEPEKTTDTALRPENVKQRITAVAKK